MSPRERPALTEDLVRPALATDGPLLSVAVLIAQTALLPRRFRCSGRRRPFAPDRLAIGDLAPSGCRQRRLAEIHRNEPPCRRFSRSLSVAELLVPADEEDHDV